MVYWRGGVAGLAATLGLVGAAPTAQAQLSLPFDFNFSGGTAAQSPAIPPIPPTPVPPGSNTARPLQKKTVSTPVKRSRSASRKMQGTTTSTYKLPGL